VKEEKEEKEWQSRAGGEEKEEKFDIDVNMDEVKDILKYSVDFGREEKETLKTFFDNKAQDAVSKVSMVYIILQLNSGVRVNELLTRDFTLEDGEVAYVESKSKKVRRFKPVFMDSKSWLNMLEKLRFITGKETTVNTVNKRINRLLEKEYPSIGRSHTLRKIYFYLVKKFQNNPLGHSNERVRDMYNTVNMDGGEELQNVAERNVSNKRRCEVCGVDVLKKGFTRHLKTKKHLDNV